MTNQGTLHIKVNQRGSRLNDLFGIFFEDLNHAADGGLYAELVRNRSFEFDPIDNRDYHSLTAWTLVERGQGKAILTVESENPLNARNTHYAVIDIVKDGDGVGLSNEGFNSGISVRQGESYRFSVYGRRESDFEEPIHIAIESADGHVHGEATIKMDSAEWKRYEAEIKSSTTDHGSRLTIVTKGSGKLFLDMVSLFPLRTFRNRSNGLREDIANMLAELKPKFMRFPGGCLVHDGSLNPDDRDSMYRWKNTIGDVAVRPPRRSNWSYHQTLGLGYYEYFQFCEDIGAKPIPILPAGYDPHHKRIVPIEELGPWIDDALDLIEFANGEPSTEWGGIRAQLGHPEPFGLEYLGIGNEEVGEPFFERYAYFHRAIKEKYPEIKIINSSGPFASGGEYERGWKSAREHQSDLVDEHYYQSPEWFLAHVGRYDEFKADDPKVFLGEYASWGNTYYNALAEAAFMIGLERNAHSVGLACYAPLLCNVDYVNWKPDLIWFNNHQVFGTANYYVQQLFMHHQGDYSIPVESNGFKAAEPLMDISPIRGTIALGTESSTVRYSGIQLINNVTGETIAYEDVNLDLAETREIEIVELGTTEWEDYTIRLQAKKIRGGARGFNVYFGRKDDKNHLSWEIGGWQNQDSIIHSTIESRGSVLTHSLFEVERGVEYDLDLRVSGRSVRASINGTVIAETEDKIPLIEPIYYSASREEITGDTILKVVNVRREPEQAKIVLEDWRENVPITLEIHELSGYALEEVNSFENPTRIFPSVVKRISDNASFEYEFPGYSVSVIRMRS